MKELIVRILKKYADDEINLSSPAARYILAEAILTEMRTTDESWFLDLGIDVSRIKNEKRKNLGGDIYESPDGGETVYRRKFGQYESKDLL